MESAFLILVIISLASSLSTHSPVFWQDKQPMQNLIVFPFKETISTAFPASFIPSTTLLAKISELLFPLKDAVITKTYYRDEEDATLLYSNTMIRRKENGGRYNEKFLDYEPSEEEFNDGEDQD